MGRRMKSIVALLMVLALLYWQQDELGYEISYAAEEETGEETEEKPSPSEGEETGEEESEGEKPGDSQEEPEEKPQIRKYEIVIPEADGQNGYYISCPVIKIRHVSEAGKTLCRLTDHTGRIFEQTLEHTGDMAEFGKEHFSEGENRLEVWMTNEDGKELEEFRFQKTFQIDRKAPVISMQAPQGFDHWYAGEVSLLVKAADGAAGSRVAGIRCSSNGQVLGQTGEAEATFTVPFFSQNGQSVRVEVRVVDHAGNVAWQECELLIDGEAPEAMIEGAHDYMITSQPVTIRCVARDENILAKTVAKAEQESPDGALTSREITGWTQTEAGTAAEILLETDGSYQISMEAEDQAGHKSSASRKLTVDRHNPVIRHVDELDGTYQKSFCLEHSGSDLIWDFTTFTYSVTLDGKLYPSGETVDREGVHVLEVKAVDSAGNTGTARAQFVIDHTAPVVVFQDVEEGESYEEKKSFQVTLENQADEIQEIRINGIRQKTSPSGKIYRYTVEEEKAYEISVKAVDRAGNQTVQRLTFEVVPKMTLAEKILEPVKKTLGMEETRAKEKDEDLQEDQGREKTGEWQLVLGSCAGLAAIGGAGWIVRKKKKLKA